MTFEGIRFTYKSSVSISHAYGGLCVVTCNKKGRDFKLALELLLVNNLSLHLLSTDSFI